MRSDASGGERKSKIGLDLIRVGRADLPDRYNSQVRATLQGSWTSHYLDAHCQHRLNVCSAIAWVQMTDGTEGFRPSRVGCSGWMYKHWRGTVYPESVPERRWLEYYASLFETVEINSTFYRLPTEATVRSWAAQTTPNFVYSVKLGSYGSHRKKLSDSASWLPNHLDRMELLGSSLGPTLVQLPPRWHRNVDRLDEFLGQVPADRRWALEIRDSSWLHDDVYDLLHRYNVALCIHDLLEGLPWELTADWTYLRFHGPNAVSTRTRASTGRGASVPWPTVWPHGARRGLTYMHTSITTILVLLPRTPAG